MRIVPCWFLWQNFGLLLFPQNDTCNCPELGTFEQYLVLLEHSSLRCTYICLGSHIFTLKSNQTKSEAASMRQNHSGSHNVNYKALHLIVKLRWQPQSEAA